MKFITTENGTRLELMDVKGKPYLSVAYRIVWFREKHPDWSIQTKLQVVDQTCLAEATISDAEGKVKSMAHKFEDIKGFNDFREKAETGSIGRALANLGFGTAFALADLDEGDRIVDAPIESKPKNHAPQPKVDNSNIKDYGDWTIPGGKFKGQAIKDVKLEYLQSYKTCLESKTSFFKICESEILSNIDKILGLYSKAGDTPILFKPPSLVKE